MTIANTVIICNAMAHMSSPSMDLGSIAQGTLQSARVHSICYIEAKKMALCA